MSQSIVQGTFEHFLKGDEHELWYVQWIVVPLLQVLLSHNLCWSVLPPLFFFVCPFSFIPKGARSLWIYFSCHIHLVIKYPSRFWKLFRLCLLSICLFKQIEVAQVTNFPKTLSLYQISYA
jgi:hypothetical protein